MPSIAIGATVGSFEIVSLLGKGGMGEVYRARDLKLNRDVAIKTLPEEFSRDPERISRFQREAQALAALNHSNIGSIYDLQEVNGSRYLVLELVEGETLADIIATRGALPVDEALNIAKGISDALEMAHDKGIIHRDLKPANIKITPDGHVKVLDFGLAKVREPDGPRRNLSNSPTLMTAAMPGIILGTAGYMSPEQAKGQPVDRRTDVFAFGCVLYEMLTGRATFDGDDLTECLGRVVTAEPDWNRLPAKTHPAILRLLQRSLRKNPRQRLGDMRDARIEIEEALKEPYAAAGSVAPSGNVHLAWILAAAMALVAVTAAVPAIRHLGEAPVVPAAEMRLDINTPLTSAPFEFALSPNGKYIAFVASGDGPQRLWLRPLDKADAQPMAGTEGADYPFWSPESRSIGYFASGKLYKVDLGGGLPQPLATAPNGRGGSWNTDGTILFAPDSVVGLMRITSSGGDPVEVTKLEPGQAGHRFPQFSKDGRHFLFYATGSPESAGVYLGLLDRGKPKRLTPSEASAAYFSPDRIIFMRQGALVSRSIDSSLGEWSGDPITLAAPVGYDAAFSLGAFSVSGEGLIAYRAGAGQQQFTWFDRNGKVLGVVGEPDDDTNINAPELSPDGRYLAFERTVQSNMDVWLRDLIRGGLTRFTTHAAIERYPVWSREGKEIVFSSTRNGPQQLYLKPFNSSKEEQPLPETPNITQPQDWSSDGWLLYYELVPKTGRDIWALKMTGSDKGKKRVVANTPVEERIGQFSPNGEWVAYETNKSGKFEIVVQAFPNAAGLTPVSTGGGVQPRWSSDGKEIYFISPDGRMMAAAVKYAQNGSSLEVETPVTLFPTRIGKFGTSFKPQYVVSSDGRFLIAQPLRESITPITLILNWKSDP